jgi:fibronectin-binding autotransporter adhesin
MSKFNYTLPSGATFVMEAPEGTTQAQADLIFYSQVAAGTVAGFTAGQSISTATSSATKFALSRLDRGTAGVDDTVILAIVNGLPQVATLPTLINTPLTDPITQSDIARINSSGFTAPAIGPLTSGQVQGIMAQVSNFVDQPATVMSNDKGVGQYGLSCQQLEQAGYVKPNTWQQFIFDPAPLTEVLSAPGVFTGLNGINSARDFLTSTVAQNDAMGKLLKTGYDSLSAAGVISPPVTASISALKGQIYTQSGLQTLSQFSASTGLNFDISSLTSGLPSLGSLTAGLPNVDQLTSTLKDSALGKLATSTVTNLQSIGSGAINSVTGGSLQNLTGVVDKIKGTVTDGVGSLVANAGKFGTNLAAQWASSIPSINSLTSSLPSVASLTSKLPTLTNVGDLIEGQIPGLPTVKTAMDTLGKASQFATSATNPLTNLNNLGGVNINNLTASATGALNNLTASATGALNTLTASATSAATGAFNNLTANLPNIGNFGSLTNLTNLLGPGASGILGGSSDSLVAATLPAGGFSNTVNRATVDVATAKIFGSSKIPTPSFGYPDPSSPTVAAILDISAAQSKLQELQGSANRLLGGVQNAIGSSLGGISAQVNTLAGTATNAVRSIV